jgi:hypothetical protein
MISRSSLFLSLSLPLSTTHVHIHINSTNTIKEKDLSFPSAFSCTQHKYKKNTMNRAILVNFVLIVSTEYSYRLDDSPEMDLISSCQFVLFWFLVHYHFTILHFTVWKSTLTLVSLFLLFFQIYSATRQTKNMTDLCRSS